MGNQCPKIEEGSPASNEDDAGEASLAQKLQEAHSRINVQITKLREVLKESRREHQRELENLKLFKIWEETTIKKLEKEGQIRITWKNKLVFVKEKAALRRLACRWAKLMIRAQKIIICYSRMQTKLEKRLTSLPVVPVLVVNEVELVDGGKFLPVEMWTVILGNLTDTKDLWNCTNACQLFSEILGDWKTKWMFEQALPHLFPHLPKQKFLECRLVCKGWNGVIDNFLGEHPSVRPYGNDMPLDRRTLPFVNPLREKNLDKVNDYSFTPDSPDIEATFLEFHWIQGRNPFIGRALTLKIGLNSFDEDISNGKLSNRQIWDYIFSFLESYGKEIWHLKITATLEDQLSDQVVQKVSEFFLVDLCTLAPNIRSLSIMFQNPDFLLPVNPLMVFGGTLPAKFSKLDTLSITYSPNFIGYVTVGRYWDQLQSLRVTAETWNTLSELEWPKLKALHLEHIVRREHFEKLIESKKNIPQLGFLELNLNLDDHNRSIWDFDWCQRAVKKLSSVTKLKTIRVSELTFRGDSLLQGLGNNLSIMPHSLTTLEFEYSSLLILQVPSFSFLVRFPFLQNLHVFWRTIRSEEGILEARNEIGLLEESTYGYQIQDLPESKEIVEVNKYIFRKEMYKSNIWKVLPRLNLFSFQWDVYTRTGYEQFVAQKKTENISSI